MTRVAPFLIPAIGLTIGNFLCVALWDQSFRVAVEHSVFQSVACAMCYFNYRFGAA